MSQQPVIGALNRLLTHQRHFLADYLGDAPITQKQAKYGGGDGEVY